MYEYFPKSILPAEYGGDAGPIQDLIGIIISFFLRKYIFLFDCRLLEEEG